MEESEAFRQIKSDTHNEKWTQLLLDLGFFDEHSNHIMSLRRRFVCGAADWLAGNNGSLRNDKEILGYNDSQWKFIWNTMLVDGAWAVPSIIDFQGNVLKENLAPELLIKYIAHDLKSHILVFDLVLEKIQFISGNHLKTDNVVFDSPLLLYSTGSHFQSVFPSDPELFVNIAKDMDRGIYLNDQPSRNISVLRDQCKDQNEPRKVTQAGLNSTQQCLSSKKDAPAPKGPIKSTREVSSTAESSKAKTGFVDTNCANNAGLSRSYCFDTSKETSTLEDMKLNSEFEFIRRMKKKDRSPSQQRLFEKVKKQMQRKKQTQEQKNEIRQNDKEQKREKRAGETVEETLLRKNKDQEQKKRK